MKNGITAVATLNDVKKIPNTFHLPDGKNSAIVVNANCNTPPAAVKPSTKPAIIHIIGVGSYIE